MLQDELFMQRAFDLAAKGMGDVSPNPMVGCVIVHQGKVIGEGFHKKYGDWHAEPNAVNSVENKELIKESTVYVTLEPCSHQGKTPPCADLLVKVKPKKVVVANLDPNPLVAGKGMKKLKEAGIETVSGVLAEVGEGLNKRFFTVMRKKRPFVLLKWAQTKDGFVARKNYDSKWISNPDSRKLVHKMRAENDAIMVGYNTALHDNPKLNVREVEGNDPVRLVIDKQLKLPVTHFLFDNNQPTIVYNAEINKIDDKVEYVKLDGNEYISQILENLYQRNVSSVLIEGGSGVLHSVIEQGLWDEAQVFIGDIEFGAGIKAPILEVTPIGEENISGDRLLSYKK